MSIPKIRWSSSRTTVLLEVQNDLYEEARDALARFAELEKSPEYLHTYRITPLSLWNAAAAGLSADEILRSLERYSKYDLPPNVRVDIAEQVSRYGRIRLTRRDGDLAVESDDVALIAEIARHKAVVPLIKSQPDARTLITDLLHRGRLKQALVGIGYPAQDEAGYTEERALPFQLRNPTLAGESFLLRLYQHDSVEVFHASGAASGGSGVIVLPCGAGKTMVGMGVMAACRPLGEQAVGVAPGITPEKTASQPLASDSSGKGLDQNIYQRFPDSFRIARRGPC